ncbi:MAG TPA: biotin/lipoyl-binding protein [Verrucomicrobiae bacterium]|nr:biotin/lipoyl-binding protein [Verrucomicrobiae bacterium]
MSEASKTFSESWYRVAGQRLYLRPSVRVRRQNFRGERWIVLEDPFSNQFFRLRPAAYEFVARLRPDRTVEEAWDACLQRFPDEAPGQEAVLQLLSQLYFANLLQYDAATDSAQLFDRYKKRKQRELGFNLLNIMFMRFPLLDPDRFLVKTLPFVGKFISPLGAILWLIVTGLGVRTVVDNFDALRQQGEGILAPSNLALLYLGLVLIKALHEFGHAYFCRRFGGEVHVLGVMLMIFTPLPYVDATSSWSFRSRWQRCLVGAAGMIVEIFFAAIASFIWARTSPGTLHSLAYNIMFVASVSTLVFNLNPLLRFDGYYILSDLIEIPNLNQRAGMQLRHWSERYLFGVRRSESPAEKPGEAAWYAGYGVTSGIYRVIVFGGVLFAVADRFLIIGIVMAAVCLISWVTVPMGRFFRYLASSPNLDRVRGRAIGVTAGAAAGLLLLLAVVPFPCGFRAPGVVKTTQRTALATQAPGEVAAILVRPGATVKRGEALVKLENHELELDLAAAQARRDEVAARLLQAMKEESADIAPLTQLRDAVDKDVQKLTVDMEHLVVRAPHDGIWVAPGIDEFDGRWLSRGSNLGLVVNPRSFEFVATVLQDDVNYLFSRGIRGAKVRLVGNAGTPLLLEKWRVIPGEQKALPSAALGWAGGGDVPIAADDPSGSKALEPFFEVIGPIQPNAALPLLDGRSGKVRFELPPEPLLPHWLRRAWQILQKRYQV